MFVVISMIFNPATLSKQLAAIEHEISVRSTTFDDILKNLSLAFDLLEDCGMTYRKANDNIKKLMCQAIFKRIWIHEDGTVTTEFTDIYKNIVGPIERDLINQNIKSASAETDADFIDKLLKSYSNFFGQGLNNELLVEPRRVELLSENPSTRLSTSVAGVLTFPLSSPQRQGQDFGSFIRSHLRQSLCRLVPHIDDARDPGRGQPGTDGHCLSSDGYEIRFVSYFLIPAFNEARGFGSLIRLQRSPSKPFTAP